MAETGNGILDRMQRAGIVPPETCRLIIDIGIDCVVRVYYECLADEKLIDVDLVSGLEGVEPQRVQKMVGYPCELREVQGALKHLIEYVEKASRKDGSRRALET